MIPILTLLLSLGYEAFFSRVKHITDGEIQAIPQHTGVRVDVAEPSVGQEVIGDLALEEVEGMARQAEKKLTGPKDVVQVGQPATTSELEFPAQAGIWAVEEVEGE